MDLECFFFFNYGFLNPECIFLLRIGGSGMFFLMMHILNYGLVDPKFYRKCQSEIFPDFIIHNANNKYSSSAF